MKKQLLDAAVIVVVVDAGPQSRKKLMNSQPLLEQGWPRGLNTDFCAPLCLAGVDCWRVFVVLVRSSMQAGKHCCHVRSAGGRVIRSSRHHTVRLIQVWTTRVFTESSHSAHVCCRQASLTVTIQNRVLFRGLAAESGATCFLSSSSWREPNPNNI